jgi:hypothetical protein
MTDTATPPLVANAQPSASPKWRRCVTALVSFATRASRVHHEDLARVSHKQARRRRNRDAGRPFQIALGPRGVTVSPARFERWAFWGFLFGVVDGVASNAQAWPRHDWGEIIASLLSMGAATAVIGVLLARLWNWAGTSR